MPTRTAFQTKPQALLVKSAELVLGIDAGATKTTAAIGTAGKIIGIGKSGSANIHTTASKDIIKHLRAAVEVAWKLNKVPGAEKFSSIVVGMAGIDSPQDQMTAEKLVMQALQPWLSSHTKLRVVNDIHIVRRSGSNNPYGVALIAGTGTHAFGITKQGDIAYAGGLEYILSDEGSGYDMGLKVLRAAVKSADGRTKHTHLEDAVLKKYHIKSVRALERIVYHSQKFDKSDIAKLAKLVDEFAATGDWRAKEIINETLHELVALVGAVISRLHLQHDIFDIVIVGGVFEISSVPFVSRFTSAIKKIAPRAGVVMPEHPPVWGAIRLAQDQLQV